MLCAAASPPRIPTLILLPALAVLSGNMFAPSLSNMAADFGVDYALVNLSVAGYLAITAVLQLIMGPLSDRYGRRPVLLGSLTLFTLASLGCALADDIWLFLGFRLLQGAVMSAWALSQTAIRDMHAPQRAASLMGYVAMAMAVAPMLGPMAGGALDAAFGWRATFVFFAGAGAGLLMLSWVDFGETHTTRSETFIAQFRAYPELFRSRRFWGYAACMAFSTSAFYAFLSGAPFVAEHVLDLPTARLGAYMGSITAGFFLGSYLSGRLAARRALTTMLIAGRIAACAGLCGGLALILSGVVNEFALFGATIFVGVGNGLTMPSANVGAMSVRPSLAGSAAGLSGALTVGAGAGITWLTGAMLTPASGAVQLLGVMLFCSAAGMIAALSVWRIDRREGLIAETARDSGTRRSW